MAREPVTTEKPEARTQDVEAGALPSINEPPGSNVLAPPPEKAAEKDEEGADPDELEEKIAEAEDEGDVKPKRRR